MSEFIKKHKHVFLLALAVFVVALLPRLWGVGQFLTADEKNWVGRSYEFLRAFREFRINDTLQTTHPGITTLWITGITTFVTTRLINIPFNFDKILEFVTAAQYSMAVVNALVVAAVFLVLRKLLSNRIALLASLAIALNPFLIGYSKLVHVDALMSGLLVVAALLLIYAERSRKELFLVLSAVFGAMAIVTKLPAIFIIPYALLVLFSRREVWQKRVIKERLRMFGLWLFVVVVLVVVLWPSLLWVPDPVGNVNQVRKDMTTAATVPHHMADEYRVDIWHYPVTLLSRSTVPSLIGAIVLLAALATPALRKQVKKIVSARFLLLLTTFAIFFIAMMTIGAKKGDRYILPVFLMLDILGVIGIYSLFMYFFRKKNLGKEFIAKFTTAAVLAPLAASLFTLGPYTLAYYNPLFPPDLSEQIGWGEGLDKVAKYLDKQEGKGMVASWYPEELDALTKKRQVLHINAHEQTRIGYVVLYRNMFGRPKSHWANDFIDRYYKKKEPVFTAKINGLEYAWVYKKPLYTGIVGELTPAKVLVFKLDSKEDNLTQVDLMTATYNGKATSGSMTFHLRNRLDVEDARTVTKRVNELPDKGYAEFAFEPVADSKNKEYFIVITTEGTFTSNAPTVRAAPAEKDNHYAVLPVEKLSENTFQDNLNKGKIGMEWYFMKDEKKVTHEEVE